MGGVKRGRVKTVGHCAKQTECGVPADVYINTWAHCLIATSLVLHHLEEMSDEKLSFRNRRKKMRDFCTN